MKTNFNKQHHWMTSGRLIFIT